MNKTWTRYSSDAGRQRERECGHKLTSVAGVGAGAGVGREGARGTTGQPKQRSDTDKSSGSDREEGQMPQASPGAWPLLEGEVPSSDLTFSCYC